MNLIEYKLHSVDINGISFLIKRIKPSHGFITYKLEFNKNIWQSFHMLSADGKSFTFVQRNNLTEQILNLEDYLSETLVSIYSTEE